MRIGLAIGALTAGLFAATAPAAAQGWGYADYGPGVGVSVGFGGPAYGAYAAAPGYYAPGYAYSGYAAPGACSCAGPAYGYGGGYAYQPGYAYRSTYAYQPGYAAGYAYEPGYGPAYGSETYSYSSGPRYVSRGSRTVARGEIRENTRSATVAREQRGVRTRSSGVAVREGTNGAGVRAEQSVRGEATVGQGGEMRGATSARASARSEPSVRGGEPRGRSRGAGEPGLQ
jgi:hypothetical protein